MANIYCALFGHKYKVSRHITNHIKEYKCERCQAEITTNSSGKMIPLTERHRQINSELHQIFVRKRAVKR